MHGREDIRGKEYNERIRAKEIRRKKIRYTNKAIILDTLNISRTDL